MVREKNGAYGVMAGLNRGNGQIYMTSYRDPQIMETLNAYQNAGKALLAEISSGSLLESDIATAIIGTIGSIDGSAPSPAQVGWITMMRWIYGSNAENRQRLRNQILNTSREDFVYFATRLTHYWRLPSVAIVASESAINDAPELDLYLLKN